MAFTTISFVLTVVAAFMLAIYAQNENIPYAAFCIIVLIFETLNFLGVI